MDLSRLVTRRPNFSRLVSRRPHQERLRAIVKTVLYRFFMVTITIVIAWAVTGDTVDALNIGLVTNAVKTGTYYGYERAWDRISWGLPGKG